ncbi:MAG TPA: hypothetical protein VGB20_05205 [bacterium]
MSGMTHRLIRGLRVGCGPWAVGCGAIRNAAPRRRARRSGLTIVELVVVALLLGLMTAALLSTFLSGQASFLSTDASIHVQEEARRAFNTVVRELREAGGVSTTALPNGAIQLNFQIARGYNQAGCPNAICWGSEQALNEWVHYSIVGNAGNARQLIRCTDTNATGAVTAVVAGCRVLANHVRHPNAANSAAFVWDAANRMVTINLEIEYQNPALPTGVRTTGVLTSRVALRNP